MPIFSTLLFLFLALALLPLAFRGSHTRQARREQSALEERMTLGAAICIAAAREAFGVELDRSLESIASLNALIDNGWSGAPVPESQGTSNSDSNELLFVLAAYLGTVFALHRAAEWRIENGKPALYFRTINESEYPFDLIELKFRENQTDLARETLRWGMPPEPAPANIPSANSDEQPSE